MFEHFGVLLFELLKFSTLSTEGMRRAVEFEGEDRVRAAYAQGKGVLFFTGHFGFWELHAIVHGLLFEPIGVLARALDNPGLHAARDRAPAHRQHRDLPRRAPCGKVLRTLMAGHGVAMLIDQHMHSPDAIWVRLLRAPGGHDVDAGGAGAAHRRARSCRCSRCRCRGGRYPTDLRARGRTAAGRRPMPIREFTQRCTDVLEMYVRRHPELWLWMHRRWRDAPAPRNQRHVPRRHGHDGARRCLTARSGSSSLRPTGWATP